MIIVGMGYYYTSAKSSCDKPDISALIRFGANIADFATDLIFSAVLFEEGETVLGILSLIFTLVPYLVSCGVGLYVIEQWRVGNDSRLLPYLKKHDTVLLILSVVAGFYSAVSILRSKLFAMEMFMLQLRQSDIKRLDTFRFFNTVGMLRFLYTFV